jgi:hypothetical protein
VPVEFRCDCGKLLRVKDEYAGRQGTCPACGELLDVPAAEGGGRGAILVSPVSEGLTTTPATTPGEPVDHAGLLEDVPEVPDVTRPAYRLSSAGEVFAGTFLFGPLAGITLIAWNYRVLGRPRAFVLVSLLGLGLTVAVAALSLLASSVGLGIVVVIFAVFCWVALPACARLLQGRAYDEHVAAGGPKGTLGRILGLGFCSLALWVSVFAAVGVLQSLPYLGESKVVQGNFSVTYTGGATKAEADRLASYLVNKWLGAGQISVELKRAGDGYQFRMVIKKEFQHDPKTLKKLEFDAARISRDVFSGAAVEFQACDEYFRTIQTLPPRADIRYSVVRGKAEVFFPAGVEKSDAERLAEHLAPLAEGAPSPITFKLARRGAVVEVHMVVRPEVVGNPNFIAALGVDRANIAAAVFPNAPVEMHLCDDGLNVIRVLKP